MTQRRAKKPPETFVCPHCGADVVVGAKVCRECGSDADTGWQSQEEIDYQSVDLPQGYRRDDEHQSMALPETRTPRWVVVTALLLAVLLLGYASRLLL